MTVIGFYLMIGVVALGVFVALHAATLNEPPAFGPDRQTVRTDDDADDEGDNE